MGNSSLAALQADYADSDGQPEAAAPSSALDAPAAAEAEEAPNKRQKTDEAASAPS